VEQEKGKRCGKCFPAGREIRSPRRQSPTRVGNCKEEVSVMRPHGRLCSAQKVQEERQFSAIDVIIENRCLQSSFATRTWASSPRLDPVGCSEAHAQMRVRLWSSYHEALCKIFSTQLSNLTISKIKQGRFLSPHHLESRVQLLDAHQKQQPLLRV